jgi:hypothetical protein
MATIPERITVRQAYTAMIFFLESLYERTQSDEIGGLLGSLQLMDDGRPFDPAAWQDWLEAVEKLPD